MMHGQKKRAKWTCTCSPSIEDDSRKENKESGTTSEDSWSVTSKRSHSKCMNRTSARQQFGKMIEIMEWHEKFQLELLQEQRKANIELLDILRQGLLKS